MTILVIALAYFAYDKFVLRPVGDTVTAETVAYQMDQILFGE